MNLSKPITQLQLFYITKPGERAHWEVHWKRKKEVWNGLKFIGYSGTENRISGPFTTRAGAEGFVNNLLKHIPAFSGEFEIIEYKSN